MQERRSDRQERYLRDMKETVGKKAERYLEWACKGGDWLTVLSRSQYGTDLSKEEFRDALQWRLDIPLQNPPLTCNGWSDLFMVDRA